jgi:ABC-type glutathione transport system ATPase component
MDETVGADRVVIMDHGRIALDGAPSDVFRHADEIVGFGLRLPFAVELASRLRARGIEVPDSLLTNEAVAGWLGAAS